jgi:hypothetical protein
MRNDLCRQQSVKNNRSLHNTQAAVLFALTAPKLLLVLRQLELDLRKIRHFPIETQFRRV